MPLKTGITLTPRSPCGLIIQMGLQTNADAKILGRKVDNMLKIATKVERLNKKISELSCQITELRKICPHENLVGVYKSDSGNWCSSDNSYWVELDCKDCGNAWHEDQEGLGYDPDWNYSRTHEGFRFKKINS